MVLLMMIQKIRPGKWEELAALNEKYAAADMRLGMPTERYFRSLFGAHDMNTLITLVEWDSMAAMEAGYEKRFADSEIQKLGTQSSALVESTRMEVYQPAL